MSLMLRAETLPGDQLHTTALEMRALARRLNVGIVCSFNGCDLWAWPSTKPSEIVGRYARFLAAKEPTQ